MPNQTKNPENEGEGSRSADLAYRRGVQDFLRDNDPQELAEQAKREMEDSEAPDARRVIHALERLWEEIYLYVRGVWRQFTDPRGRVGQSHRW